jgi:hypothetical protein
MTSEIKTRDCPFCKEEVRADAIKCKHCGSSVAPEMPSHEGICPYCKEQIHLEAIICKHCKSWIGMIVELLVRSSSPESYASNVAYLAIPGLQRDYGQGCYWDCYDRHIGHGDTDLAAIHRYCQAKCRISMPDPRNFLRFVYREFI